MAQKASGWRKVFIAVLSVVTLISISPIISVVIAGLLASHFGCHVDEGSVHPCPAFGTDIGDLLYFMGVLGWLMLMTIPALVLALIGWIAVFFTRR